MSGSEGLQREGNHRCQSFLKLSHKTRIPVGLSACSMPVGLSHLLRSGKAFGGSLLKQEDAGAAT